LPLRDQLDPKKYQGGICSVKSFVDTHRGPCSAEGCDATSADWIELMDDASVQHAQLHRLMQRHGYQLTRQPVERHRNGDCACGRTA